MNEQTVWIPIEVALRRTSDDATRSYFTNGVRGEDGKFSDFIWRQGNFACDCNRFDFFECAGGRDLADFEEESDAVECSKGKFVIDWIKDLDTGEIVYSEWTLHLAKPLKENLALAHIRNGHPDVVKAAWENMPSEYEADTQDRDALLELLDAIVAAALQIEPD